MTDNSPKAVYLRMLDAYNDGTPDSYGSDKFLDQFAADAVVELPARVGSPAQKGGLELLRTGLEAANAVWRNRHSALEEAAVDGERVIGRVHWTGTSAMETPDIPAGTLLHNDYVDFCTVRDGKIVEYTFVVGPILPEGGL